MDNYNLYHFAKNTDNKEGADFTQEVQESGIPQGDLIVSKLFNTMLGETSRVLKSWTSELNNLLNEAGIIPSALSEEQILTAIKKIVKDNSVGFQLGDLVPNIGTTSPFGRMLCDGSRITNCKTLFPEFFDFVLTKTPYKTVAQWNAQKTQYGQCGFCAVEGNDVILPLITRTISGVTSLTQTGQAVNDTMRPITGDVCKINEYLNENDARWTNGAFYRRAYVGQGNGVKGGSADGYTAIAIDTTRLGANYNGTETRGKAIQYPYYIQVYTGKTEESLVNVAELVNVIKYQNQLGLIFLTQTSGNIGLSNGGLYSLAIDGDTNFILPTVTDKSIFSQILVQLEIKESGLNVNFGTNVFFVSDDVSLEIGKYNLIFEYNIALDGWVMGQIAIVEG